MDAAQPVRHDPSDASGPDTRSANPVNGLTRAELRRRAAQSGSSVQYSDDSAPVAAAVAVAAVVAAVAATDAVATIAPVSGRRSRRVAQAPVDAPSVEAPSVDAMSVDAPSVTDEARAASAQLDEFIAASQLFSFTGETAVQAPASTSEQVDEVAAETCAVPRRGLRHRLPLRRILATSFSVGAMGFACLLAVGMTTPATAVAAVAATTANANPVAAQAAGDVRSIGDDEIQAYVAPADAAGVDLGRAGDVYQTAKVAALASAYGISTPSSEFFVNDVNGDIQWPFAVGVGISYGFGNRDGGMHQGIDFTPGNGAEVQAIAAGTVRIATEDGGGYGVMVIIDHVVDGQLVSSRYGHMQYGSLRVATGDVVDVGTVVGLTGDTGRSFGAHLHLEILLGGTTAIDPMPWLQEHAG